MRRFSTLQAAFELTLAAAFWGFGFIAVVWCMSVLNAAEVTFLRFSLAFVFCIPLLGRAWRRGFVDYARRSFWPAFFLVATLIFQAWGLKYTTATKSGFITTLYVVFVPLLESMLMRRRLSGFMWACVALALLGAALIVKLDFSSVNFGDMLTFLCALFAAGQIYILGIVSPGVRQPFVFNCVQTFWCALLSAPLLWVSQVTRLPERLLAAPPKVWLGLLILALGSTLVAFYLQVRAQAKLPPTLSSLLFLLESPFALIFAVYFLSETMGPLESAGAALIFASAVMASIRENWTRKNARKT